MQNTNTKIPRLGLRPTSIIIDEMMKQMSRKQLQKLAIKFKESKMPRDNNCKENHERGLKKRKEIFGIQETVRSIQTSKRLFELNQFYGKTLKMLKLA